LEGIMSKSRRRAVWLLLVLLFIVAVPPLLALWGVWSFLTGLTGAAPVRYDLPTQLASVPVPARPNSLAWSADGRYLAAGTWGLPTGETGPGEVYVVDIDKASVVATLKATSWVEGLVFSPDGKWLAIADRPSIPDGAAPAELVVFDVPAFTTRFTAKADSHENGFIDLAWAADSKSLHAIEGPVDNAQGNAEVRRWDVPAFSEPTAIPVPQTARYNALAASPDGHTLAVADATATNARMIRLFDLGEGTVRSSFKVGDDNGAARLGFTPDDQALGVFDRRGLSWWDVGTGRPANPDPARFTTQPAGLCYFRSNDAMSPDGRTKAHGYERHRGFGDLGWDNRANEFGAFVEVTRIAPERTWTWRVAEEASAPAVVFSPDGTKLAGTVGQSNGASIVIWAVPK
jgi:WD40 repeat protein